MTPKETLCIADATAVTVHRLLSEKKIVGQIFTAQDFLEDCEGSRSTPEIDLVIIELSSSQFEDIDLLRQKLSKRWPDVVVACLTGIPPAQDPTIFKKDSHFVEVMEVPNLSMDQWTGEGYSDDHSYLCAHEESDEQVVKDTISVVFPNVRFLSASAGSAAALCALVGAMQAIECIAISEAFMICHLLKIEKSQLLQVLQHGSAMSDILTSFPKKSGTGRIFPTTSILDDWKRYLEAICTQAKIAGLSHTLPRAAIASIATLSGELISTEISESAEYASLQKLCLKSPETTETGLAGSQESNKILVIGLGLMGIGIAKRLSKHTDTVGYDIEKSRTEEFAKAGGKVCEDIEQDCQGAAFVVVVVESEEQIQEALFDGPHAISKNLKADATIVIHSTVPPDCASRVQDRIIQIKPDVVVLDAPMSGTPAKAEDGKILVIFGGSGEHCAKFEPYLKLYTSQILKFPHLGLASQLKLIHNTVAGSNLMAAAYTMKLGHSMGFERNFLHGFIKDTNARSTYFEDRVPRILSEKSTPSAHLSIWLKDLSLAIKQYAVDTYFSPLVAYALETYRVAAIYQGDTVGDHNVYDIW